MTVVLERWRGALVGAAARGAGVGGGAGVLCLFLFFCLVFPCRDVEVLSLHF